MTVGELLSRITSEELTEWKLFFQIRRNEMKMAADHPGLG